MDAVVIGSLVKDYKNTRAVDGISFSIKKGEIFGFLGPNGAGKTTTINCICQLANVNGGTISINGFDTSKDYVNARRQIGLSPQDLPFDIYFSVFELLVYQGGYFGMRKKKAQERATALLTKFGLLDKKTALFRQLSGGMKRKISIAKALMHSPSVLILDEPTAGLDVDSRYDLWEFIKDINKQGMTIILTTHYIEEAERLCDRIGIISKGRIIKLEHTKTIMNELSQNVIHLHVDKKAKMPKSLAGYEYKYANGHVEVHVAKKDQNAALKKLLDVLEKNKIIVQNFSVEEDSLENIFRRLVHG